MKKTMIAALFAIASLNAIAAGATDSGRTVSISEWVQDSVSALKQRFFGADDENNIGKVLAPGVESGCKSMGATISVAKADYSRYLATCEKAGKSLITIDSWRVDPSTIRFSLRIPTPVVDALAYQYAREREPLKATPTAADSWSLLDRICDYGGASSWQMRDDGQWNRRGYCTDAAGQIEAHIVGLNLDADFVVIVSASKMPQKN